MISRLSSLVIGISLSLLTPVTALAGGGPIFLEVVPFQPFSDSRAYIITAHITPDIQYKYNCHDIPITFKLEDQQEGDVIMAGNFSSSNINHNIPNTYIFGYSERVYQGKHKADCSASAKITSAVKGERYVYVEADLPKWGKTQSGLAVMYFGDDPKSKVAQTSFYEQVYLPWEDELPPFESGMDNQLPAPPEGITVDKGSQVVGPGVEASRVGDLENKVTDLQRQLDESKMKQNFLEAQLEIIKNWLKSIFPFLK